MEKVTKEREFRNPVKDLKWEQAPGMPVGCTQAILYRDEVQGTYLRMLRVEPGVGGGSNTMFHDFDETVFIVSGGLVNERLNERYEAGQVAYFPKGTHHGPLSAPVGAVLLEFRHYVK